MWLFCFAFTHTHSHAWSTFEKWQSYTLIWPMNAKSSFMSNSCCIRWTYPHKTHNKIQFCKYYANAQNFTSNFVPCVFAIIFATIFLITFHLIVIKNSTRIKGKIKISIKWNIYGQKYWVTACWMSFWIAISYRWLFVRMQHCCIGLDSISAPFSLSFWFSVETIFKSTYEPSWFKLFINAKEFANEREGEKRCQFSHGILSIVSTTIARNTLSFSDAGLKLFAVLFIL